MNYSQGPKVSIVTPVFNGEKYLHRTIESVLSQSYPNVEYIVVDGASTDNTLNVLDRYRKEIDLIISEPDGGMYDAINKGMRSSCGQILCYLNSDDYYFPDTIITVIDRFLATKVDLVFGDCIFVNENERELYRYAGIDLPYYLIELLGRIPFAQQTAFWTRNLYNEVGGFDQQYKYVADTKFFFECLRLVGKNKSHVNECLAMFRQHDEAFSTRVAKEMAKEHRLVLSNMNIDVGTSRYFIEAIVKINNLRNFIRRCI